MYLQLEITLGKDSIAIGSGIKDEKFLVLYNCNKAPSE
jgi:hypothetical protein